MSKSVLFQTVQLSISTKYQCKKTVLFQTIQFSVQKQFCFKQFSLALVHCLVLFYPTGCYHAEPEWTWERWQWRGTPHSQKLQHYWNLTIRLFNVISKTLVGGGDTHRQEVLSVANYGAHWANYKKCITLGSFFQTLALSFSLFLDILVQDDFK